MNRRGFFGMVGKLTGLGLVTKFAPEVLQDQPQPLSELTVTEGFSAGDVLVIICYSQKDGIRRFESVRWVSPVRADAHTATIMNANWDRIDDAIGAKL